MKRILRLLSITAILLAPAALAEPAVISRNAVAKTPGKLPAYPLRIVSINPCADALLVQLADRRQIASISHYSHDRRATSIPIDQALKFPATSGTAEEILAMKPDLVVAGSLVSLPTSRALDRLGIPLVQLSIPQSVEESRAQISELSEIVGAPKRGERVNQSISAAFAKARAPDKKRVPALIWRSGGLVPGSGTLPDELLRHTGFQNISSSYGLKQWDILSLEHLVAKPPRILFSNSGDIEEDRADRMLSHPVFKKLSRRITIENYPARLLHCAGPTLIEAVETLSNARRKLQAGS